MEQLRCHKAYTPPKRAERISDTVEFTATIQHANNVFHRVNNSLQTEFNLCATEYSTSKINSKIRKSTQGSIDIPSKNIQNSNPPSSTYEGASQGGVPRKTPTGEARKKSNEKCTPIESIRQQRTSEVADHGYITRGTPTSAPSKKNVFKPKII